VTARGDLAAQFLQLPDYNIIKGRTMNCISRLSTDMKEKFRGLKF